jgi:DNA polymerase III alpha subunit (gram-positive type)
LRTRARLRTGARGCAGARGRAGARGCAGSGTCPATQSVLRVYRLRDQWFSVANAPPCDWTLPWSNYPTQISVDIVEDGEVYHAFDTVISGTTGLSAWAKAKVKLTPPQIRARMPFRAVVQRLAALLRDGDTIVAHNIGFDINMVFVRTAQKLQERDGADVPGLERVLQAPRFCTMRCAYARSLAKQPSLELLCRHFQVELVDAHDARADTRALAGCLAEAWRRGVML